MSAIRFNRCRLTTIALWLIASAAVAEPPLYEQTPSTRVVLNEANDSAELVLLPLPPGQPPRPLPQAGALRGRLVESPATEIEIPYGSIKSVERFEERLLAEAQRLADAGRYGDAYFYFARLEKDYADTPGFEQAFLKALSGEARAKFRDGQHDHALALLQTINERSPGLRGLAGAVDSIGDAILSQRWRDEDYAGVRQTIDTIRSQFGGLELSIGDRWIDRIQQRAEQQAAQAERLAEQGQTREALRLATAAADLAPESKAVADLLTRLSLAEPTLWVAVWETAPTDVPPRIDRPAASRQSDLLGGRLSQLVDYAPTGGDYESSAGQIDVGPDRRSITLRPRPGAGDGPFRFARALLLAAPTGADLLGPLRERLDTVSLGEGDRVVMRLKAPHALPEALASVALPAAVADLALGNWRRVSPDSSDPQLVRYERAAGEGPLTAIEETRYATANAAIEALRSGAAHVIADVPPAKLGLVEAIPGVQIAQQRLPVLHCLLFAEQTPLRERRELRRALCYGLAREDTLNTLLVSGEPRPGFEPLSGPLPRGLSLSDALRYAYNDSVEPRPYEPRLAALLVAAARQADADAESATRAAPVPDVVRLAHPPTPTARSAVDAIDKQLGAIGLPVQPIEASEAELASGRVAYDLRYAEIRMTEPLVDAWRLLGPGGLSGECSPAMLAGLSRAVSAPNSKEAAAALRDVHRIAFAETPVVPLWQTVGHSAFSPAVRNAPAETVGLYQTVDQWRLAPGAGP
ncbi:ABC transporter substrate-binding protein [Botrimarina sp.]|uniref:ABC transporter substrate-binding protein n=1 Tax=Botrimarina sp. TaxID=2795802 RepID=UPI0032EF41AD